MNAARLEDEPDGAAPDAARPPLAFAFTLTRDEHLRAFDDLHPLRWWHLVSWITAPGGHATRRAAIWRTGVLVLVLGAPLLFVRSSPKVALVGPTLVAIGFVWMALLRALRRRAAAATYDRNAELQGEQRWRIDEFGLEIEYSGATGEHARATKLAWRDLMRIEETRDGFGFVVSLERSGFLPRRAVGDRDLLRLRELLARVSPAAEPPVPPTPIVN